MNWGIALGIFVAGMCVGMAVVAGTDVAPWVLDSYARARGGEWRQRKFLCGGCSRLRHIARTGPIGMTSCIHCTPPATGGTR